LQRPDESFGAIGAFSSRPHEFSEADRLFAETIAHLLSTTIGRDRNQRLLDDVRRLNESILSTVEALVLLLDATGRILTINEASRRTTGFTLAELAQRPIWNTLVVHDDVAAFQSSWRRAATSSKPVEIESAVLTKSGERRQIRWNLAATRNAAGAVTSVLGTGVDITKQRVAEQQITRLAAVAKTALHGTTAPQQTTTPFASSPAERRIQPRRTYNFLQRIAPIIDGKLPERSQFQAVHCKDISSGGFSFLTNTPPPHKSFVVALGTAPAMMYLTAEAVHVTSVIRNDKTRFLVGCKYVGRANYTDKPGTNRP
jgi:PAS domain S-box-containing protein